MVTRVVLVACLALTLFVVVDVLRRDELEAQTAGWYLLLLTGLFVIRVVGQVFVVLRAPAWLPPMDEWNLMPYRLLLPIQLVFVGVLTAISLALLRDQGALAEQHSSFGRFLIGLSAVYAAAMVVRYAVRMTRRPRERWFGGAIPIVFHLVLAGFLFTWGSYYAQG
jgi:uncharacterized protein